MSTTRQLYFQRPVYYKCLRILVFHMMIYRTLVLAILKTVFLNMAIFVAIFIKSAIVSVQNKNKESEWFLRMKYIIEIFMCLFLICSCDNHDVEFNEKEQTFYIYNLLHFSIEPLDSFSKSYSYDFFWRTKGTCREVDTIC